MPRGRRPCHGDDARFASDPHWKDLVLFHEYFHGDTGRGVARATRPAGPRWSLRCIEDLAPCAAGRGAAADGTQPGRSSGAA